MCWWVSHGIFLTVSGWQLESCLFTVHKLLNSSLDCCTSVASILDHQDVSRLYLSVALIQMLYFLGVCFYLHFTIKWKCSCLLLLFVPFGALEPADRHQRTVLVRSFRGSSVVFFSFSAQFGASYFLFVLFFTFFLFPASLFFSLKEKYHKYILSLKLYRICIYRLHINMVIYPWIGTLHERLFLGSYHVEILKELFTGPRALHLLFVVGIPASLWSVSISMPLL